MIATANDFGALGVEPAQEGLHNGPGHGAHLVSDDPRYIFMSHLFQFQSVTDIWGPGLLPRPKYSPRLLY